MTTDKKPLDEALLLKAAKRVYEDWIGDGREWNIPRGAADGLDALGVALSKPFTVVDEAPLLAELKRWEGYADMLRDDRIELLRIIAAAEARQLAAPRTGDDEAAALRGQIQELGRAMYGAPRLVQGASDFVAVINKMDELWPDWRDWQRAAPKEKP